MAGQSDNAEKFLAAAAARLGATQVFGAESVSERYGSTTTGMPFQAAGVVEPVDVAQVQSLVRLAGECGVSLYPVSTGNNWGYGGAAPPRSDSVILDLHRLTAIDDRDMDLGVVAVEPGVTQQMLRDFLDERGYRYLVPVHGGGPKCSLLGNALERGYGITPHTDHFGAVTALEAVLPNGERYRTPMSEQGASGVDTLFKWGVGPYVDGLFTQGSLGVVVRAWLVLAPQPARIESFVLRVQRPEDLSAILVALRDVLKALPGIVHGVNLMNARRMLSMMIPYPADALDSDGVIADEHIQALAARHRVAPWTVLGALYGEPGVVRAARSLIRSRMRGLCSRPLFIQPVTVQRLMHLTEYLPARLTSNLRIYLHTLSKGLRIIAGIPAEVALPLVYWKQGGAGDRTGLDPARDHGGIIWYAPLVPLRAEAVAAYLTMVERVCRQHGIEPLVTLTTQSDRCVDSTLPILFDPRDAEQASRAQACYRALLEEGRALGFVPYRYPAHEMARLVEESQPYWALVKAIKTAVDPGAVIAPGRYS